MFSFGERVPGLDAHHRFAVAAAGAGVVAFATPGLSAPARVLWVWDTFAFVIIGLCWLRIVFANAGTGIRDAKLQDSNRAALFVVVLFGALASLFAVGYLLGSAHGHGGSKQAAQAVLAGLTVALSWILIHTIFALHYAHLYYRAGDASPGEPEGDGLDFPEEKHPDFLDFAYFSFVVGMTCQVSDVQITARPIRRLALLHGVLSFAFNTVIVALSINLASTFLS